MYFHPKVRKRDGEVETWSYDKVVNSLIQAGLSLDQADNVIILLEAWARNTNKQGIVNSTEIRDRLIEILAGVDEIAADSYKAYKK
jgi:transcriptional regulator NrdR family protein